LIKRPVPPKPKPRHAAPVCQFIGAPSTKWDAAMHAPQLTLDWAGMLITAMFLAVFTPPASTVSIPGAGNAAIVSSFIWSIDVSFSSRRFLASSSSFVVPPRPLGYMPRPPAAPLASSAFSVEPAGARRAGPRGCRPGNPAAVPWRPAHSPVRRRGRRPTPPRPVPIPARGPFEATRRLCSTELFDTRVTIGINE